MEIIFNAMMMFFGVSIGWLICSILSIGKIHDLRMEINALKIQAKYKQKFKSNMGVNMIKDKDLLIKKDKINKLLPDKYKIEKDITINRWEWFDYKPKATAFFNKNGTHRVAETDSDYIIKILKKETGYIWYKDPVSNYILHCDFEKKGD
ncbi:MAG: hypothetical protein ACOCRK_05690 [bacterium]